jgi:Domain of unknown function (DUF4406)
MKKNNTIYIIRNRVDKLNEFTILRMNQIQKKLENMGFTVINPINDAKINFLCKKTIRFNYKELLSSDAVYVMSDVSFKKGENTELKISLDINLLLIQDLDIAIHIEEFSTKKQTV